MAPKGFCRIALAVLLCSLVTGQNIFAPVDNAFFEACRCLGFYDVEYDSSECLYGILFSVEQDIPDIPELEEINYNLYRAHEILADYIETAPPHDHGEHPDDDFNHYVPHLGNIECGPDYIEGLLVVENLAHELGTVCDDHFDYNAADVVCRYLGFDFGEPLFQTVNGGDTGLPIVLDDVRCTGYEYELHECRERAWGDHDCSHEEDVAIRCHHVNVMRDSFEDILTGEYACEEYHVAEELTPNIVGVNDGNYATGRVEVYSNIQEHSGSVCDDHWDDNAAQVVCSYYGYVHGEARYLYNPNPSYGPAEEYVPIALDDVICHGYELNLAECQHNGWGNHNCEHLEDAGVFCWNEWEYSPEQIDNTLNPPVEYLVDDFDVALGDIECGEGFVEGTLIVNSELGQGTVCDNWFDYNDDAANVVCRELGFEMGVVTDRTGPADMAIALDDIECTGSEESLSMCQRLPWGTNDCEHVDDVGVRCFNFLEPSVEFYDVIQDTVACLDQTGGDETEDPTDEEPTVSEQSIQLGEVMCGSNFVEGLLIYEQEEFRGTVCSDKFIRNNNGADVACRALGYSHGESYERDGSASGLDIVLDNVRCDGTESNLAECTTKTLGQHDCEHTQDIGIKCFYDESVGERPLTYDSVNYREACTQPEDFVVELPDYYATYIGDVQCMESYVEGLLLVDNFIQTGTVCSDAFKRTNNGADVACRNLGFDWGEVLERDGSQSGYDIVLDQLRCEGEEADFSECRSRPWGEHDCDHTQDVGVRCHFDSTVRPYPSVFDIVSQEEKCTNPDEIVVPITNYVNELYDVTCFDGYVEGLLVVESNETPDPIGLVCKDRFIANPNAANVVCRNLGFLSGEPFVRDGEYSGYNIVLDNVRCTGDETFLSDCSHRNWGGHDCEHSQDIAVRCFYDETHAPYVWDKLTGEAACFDV